MAGVTLGALAGIGFGLFQAVNRRINAAIDVYRATFALLMVGSVLLGAISLATQDVSRVWQAPGRALAAFAAGGFVHFFGGWTFLGLSQQRIGAAKTGALLGTIPLLGALAAAVVLREMVTGATLAALVVVVIGVGAVALSRQPGDQPRIRMSVSGVAFAFAAATCWATSPLLIRAGLDGLNSPLLGVTVGMCSTTLACGAGIAIMSPPSQATPIRPLLGPVLLAGTLVGLSIWLYWTALDVEQVGVVLAVLQLSSPTVALVAPVVSGDPMERGGVWLWLGLGLILAGSVTLLLRSA